MVVPVTNFRRSIPLLIGTNVILAVRDSMHTKYGRGLMSKTRQKSQTWYSAFQCVNTDGVDIARPNGEIGQLRYTGRRQIEVQPGNEVVIFVKAPKSTRGRTITALVEGEDHESLAVGRMLVEVRDGKTPIRLCNFSQQVVTVRRNTVVATLSSVREVNSSPSHHAKEAVTSEQTVTEDCFLADVHIQNEDLSPSQKKAIEDLLMQNTDVFSKNSMDYRLD